MGLLQQGKDGESTNTEALSNYKSNFLCFWFKSLAVSFRRPFPWLTQLAYTNRVHWGCGPGAHRDLSGVFHHQKSSLATVKIVGNIPRDFVPERELAKTQRFAGVKPA